METVEISKERLIELLAAECEVVSLYDSGIDSELFVEAERETVSYYSEKFNAKFSGYVDIAKYILEKGLEG